MIAACFFMCARTPSMSRKNRTWRSSVSLSGPIVERERCSRIHATFFSLAAMPEIPAPAKLTLDVEP
jgi:hypothetical protein